MQIDTSGITYSRIPTGSQERVREKSKEFVPDQVNRHSQATSRVQGSQRKDAPSPVHGAEVDSPMSKYLSKEEKEMIQRLFPPSGRYAGIRAYQNDGHTHRLESTLGRKLDIVT